ncbi:hypothetical protein NYP20_08770 [Pseudomonas sp. N3-W]|uniref:hypothetical protein n=1 Tax=Pseudomonas sp. N3-W TaxID=2975049 RepID=UPI00217E6C8A|nr:hypothetical protein [Pseudomonas sp. N3-W]UWF51036.1 hypothetical protein NYP20_08770 [Pseudomonas sp. N3-W]
MIKKYDVVVLAVGEIVEEEVFLLVNGVKVRCFASCCPSRLQVGESYEVEFELVLPDDVFVVLAEESSATLIEMPDDGFACTLYGYLDGSTFRSFVDFADQEIHYDYPALNEKFVKIKAYRIDVSF